MEKKTTPGAMSCSCEKPEETARTVLANTQEESAQGCEDPQACSRQTVEQNELNGTVCHTRRSDAPDMMVTRLEHRQAQDQFTVGLKGYGQPHQHPLYNTSQAAHGRYAPPPGLNSAKFPRNSSFTKKQGLGGMVPEGCFTTSIKKDFVYKPI